MIKDYLTIILITMVTMFYVEHNKLNERYIEAITIAVELEEINNSFIVMVSSLNEHIDDLEESHYLIKDLL